MQDWFAANARWLVPYAAFCFLRDLFGTAEHWNWGVMATPTPEVRGHGTTADSVPAAAAAA
jgi:4-alpha-glucanotransferase